MEFLKILNDGIIPYLLDYKLSAAALIGCILLCMIPAYFLGSLNFAVILSGRFYGEDVRQKGSGNAGMTNMLRNYGKGAAALTLLGDVLKAVIACLIGYFAFGITGAYLAGLFCVLGHMFPIYYHFKGGKGVATTAALMLMVHPPLFLILLVVFALIVLSTKYVSLASIMCVMIWPLFLSQMETTLGAPVLISLVIAALVVFMHRSNIKRLLRGEENKISLGKKKPKAEKEDEENG